MVVEAVTFDYWDTIVRAEPPPFKQSRLEALVSVFVARGVALDIGDVEAQMSAVFAEEFTPAWQRNEQFTAADAARSLVRRLDPAGRLGVAAADTVIEAFVSAPHAVSTELAPGVADAIATLTDAGVRVGIICDVGLTPSTALRAVLEAHDLLPRFGHWSFSDEVGVYKPDPRIFEHALAGLGGVRPERTAHIGDLRRTDIAGALAMGMTAIRYAGVADDQTDGPEGHHVLLDHADLPGLLLGGRT